MKKLKNSGRLLLQWLPLIAVGVIAAIAFHYRRYFSLDILLSVMPPQPLAAAAALMGLFALKSLSIVFPILVIYALSGLLFPPVFAILVNLAGTAAALTLPYGLGRLAGTELVEHIFQKYPKAHSLRDFQQHNAWFFSCILRLLGFLPGDVVSMYLGASKQPFWPSLLGGILGMIPAMLAGTFLGDSLGNMSSPLFWVSLGGMVFLSVVSILLYRRHMKRHAENSRSVKENHGGTHQKQ